MKKVTFVMSMAAILFGAGAANATVSVPTIPTPTLDQYNSGLNTAYREIVNQFAAGIGHQSTLVENFNDTENKAFLSGLGTYIGQISGDADKAKAFNAFYTIVNVGTMIDDAEAIIYPALTSGIKAANGQVQSVVTQVNSEFTATNQQVSLNTTDISTNASAISTLATGAVATNTANIATNTASISTLNGTVAGHTTAIANNAAAINGLDDAVAELDGVVANHTDAIVTLNGTVSDHTDAISANTFAIANIQGLNSNVYSKIDALDDKIVEQGKELSGGIAATAALTGLDNHLDAGKKYGIGVGTGYYNSQAAVAFGGIARTGDAHAVNAGVSFGTQGNFTAKAGWNLQF